MGRRGVFVTLAAAGACAVAVLAVTGGSAGAAPRAARATGGGPVPLTVVGTVNLSNLPSVSPSIQAAVAQQAARKPIPLGVVPAHAGAGANAKSAGVKGGGGLSSFSSKGGKQSPGFDGITATINGGANSPENGVGSTGDVTPPDQGLAVGPGPNGTVLAEFVNQTLVFYGTNGQTLLGALPAFQVFGLTGSAFLSDPRAYWDPSSGHWFYTMFTVGSADGSTPSTQYIAVSATTNPFGEYTIFAMDTTDASNSANGCPCFGDYDMVGADANGFYITTNEFPLNNAGPGFNGTVMYAISKSGLISAAGGGATPVAQRYLVPFVSGSLGPDGGTPDPFAGYHLSPSTVTQGSSDSGAEYFVESNANLPNDATANSLEVFALLDTGSLASGGRPALVGPTTVDTENYSELPPNATQKSGPTPLGTSTGFSGVAQLATDFNAVQEVTYAGGTLYAELTTGFSYNGGTNAGAAWFELQPTAAASSITVNNAAQGYVETTQNLLYPVIGVNAKGSGYMAFSVSGPDLYPSAAYVKFSGKKGPKGSVQIAAAGAGPLDDFSCYPYFQKPLGIPEGTPCRWGDYSMAQEYNGSVYMATEYVPAQPRDVLSNWGTFVYSAKG